MQIYIVSISILLLNPNRSHNSIPTALGRCQLRTIPFVVISNLGDFIKRSSANATEIEIEIEIEIDVHNVNT